MKSAATIPHRLKAVPGDFRVEELCSLPVRPEGPFRLYRLFKRGWTTVDLLRRIARESGLPLRAFSYGGRSDRRAETVQAITVRSQRNLAREAEDHGFEPIGWADRPIGPRDVLGARFRVTLRRLEPEGGAELERRLESLPEFPAVNYFDDQRFRSLDPKRGFLAEALVRGRLEEALKGFLATTHRSQRQEVRRRRRLFAAYGGDWERLGREAAETASERRICERLGTRAENFAGALGEIPADEMSIRLAAFQAFLWNEMARRTVEEAASETLEVAGRVSSYVFPTVWRPGARPSEGSWLPVMGPDAVAPPDRQAVFRAVLEEHGLSLEDFRLPWLETARFAAQARPLFIQVEELTADSPGPDELHPGFERLTLQFTLPRGSDATVLIRRVMLRM